MKFRQYFSISGTANNGLLHHLRIYASNINIAKEYAASHFKESKVTQLPQ